MDCIKVWCEYDFGGSFGGNNNEDIILVDPNILQDEIITRIEEYLMKATNLTKEDLEGLWDWEYIVPITMELNK